MKLPVDYTRLSMYERRTVREEYIRIQGGNCSHCKSPLSGMPSPTVRSMKVRESLFPEGFFDWPVHLHHNHVTGMTIGAVHAYCNAVLWQYHGE